MGNNVSDPNETKTIIAGVIDNANKKKSNAVKTSKYSLLTFFPKNLLEQFRRLATFYYLVIAILSLLIDSPVSPIPFIIALILIIMVSMVRQGYEDILRHRTDNIINNKKVLVLKYSTFQLINYHQIRPGDLIKIEKDGEIPCDAILLWTSDSKGKCFVKTANLDGETNLKSLKIPTPLMNTTINDLDKIKIQIEYLPPESDIYTFYGKLTVGDSISTPITTQNLLLRSSIIKNTEWAIGCAIYTGKETKLVLNSKFTSNKFSSCEKYVNNYLLFFIVLIIAIIELSYFVKRYIDSEKTGHNVYLGNMLIENGFASFAQDALSFLMLFNYFIPIALYVTVELHKFFGSLFFGWDVDLYCDEANMPAIVNTSDLNEELGQIEILFSDKTGTLTKNDMYFQMCSINGNIFIEKDKILYDMQGEKIKYCQDASKSDIQFFFTILALCHSANVEESFNNNDIDAFNADERIPKYQAASSDELALIQAAANYGVIFKGDDSNKLFIKYKDGCVETFQKLQTLDFTSARGKMSIIFKNSNGKIWLFTKGADNVIFPLCSESLNKNNLYEDSQQFAMKGLRTLVFAYKELTEEEFLTLNKEITSIGMDLKRRLSNEESNCWIAIEKDLIVLGATGVEDRLQDDVTETMEVIREAGIKIWVLTGDKVETSINVAQSCKHIPEASEKLYLTNMVNRDILQSELQRGLTMSNFFYDSHLTLILDGQTVSLILNSADEGDFIKLALQCEAVICCRLSPLQKSQIIKIIKSSAGKPVTAAIGDGANDISMIQEAHIGFGLFGKEGIHAARAADFSFAKFMMLKKILLVHGHWYYERFATLVHFSFYKSLIFVTTMFLFQFYCNFSTQSIFDSMFHTNYNLIYSSLPIGILSLGEHCHTLEELMSNPKLYKHHNKYKLLSTKYFCGWSLLGLLHTIIIFYFNYTMWYPGSVMNSDGRTSELWCFGSTLFHSIVLVVNVTVLLQAKYQTPIFIITVILTILIFIGTNTGYTYMNFLNDGDVYGTYTRLLSTPSFWIMNILITATTSLLFLLYKVFKKLHKDKKL